MRYALKLLRNPVALANARAVASTSASTVALKRASTTPLSSAVGVLVLPSCIRIKSYLITLIHVRAKLFFILFLRDPIIASITHSDSMPRTTRTKTISLDPDVERKGVKQARRRGFKNSFSAYVAKLIVEDADELRRLDAAGASTQRKLVNA